MASGLTQVDSAVQSTESKTQDKVTIVDPNKAYLQEAPPNENGQLVGSSRQIVEESAERILLKIKDLALWTTQQNVLDAVDECKHGRIIKVPFFKQDAVSNRQCDPAERHRNNSEQEHNGATEAHPKLENGGTKSDPVETQLANGSDSSVALIESKESAESDETTDILLRELRLVVRSCTNADSTKRPSASEIAETLHNYL